MAYEWLFEAPQPQPGSIGSLVGPVQAQPAPQQGVGQMVDGGLNPAVAPGPPKDQADFANRAKGWSVLADKFKTDPTYQLALLKFGTSLMQPVAPGQSAAGHVGQAVQGGADLLLQQQAAARRNQLAERQVQVLERAQGEKEKTGALTREEMTQRIEQNKKSYPKLIEKLDAEIARMESQGELDSAQAELAREKVRQYPTEIEADLRRAKAAERAAGKPSSGEVTGRIFESTVKAMVKSEGITEDEARARLGAGFLGKASGKSAGVQNAEQFKRDWKIANPIKEGETPQAYEQRAAQAVLNYQTQKKSEDYMSQKLEFINKNGILFKTIDEAEAKFDEYWTKSGNPLPGADNAQPKGRTEVSMEEVRATAKARGIDEKTLIEALKKKGIKIKGQK